MTETTFLTDNRSRSRNITFIGGFGLLILLFLVGLIAGAVDISFERTLCLYNWR